MDVRKHAPRKMWNAMVVMYLTSYAIAKFIVQNRDLKIGSDIIDPGSDALELAKRIANFIAKDLDLLESEPISSEGDK